jgi:hypothetical protein
MILYIVVCTCLGQSMGLEPTLPYLSPELNGQRLLNGANFASAGIGILNDTGIQFVSSILSSSKFHYISLILYILTRHFFQLCCLIWKALARM